MHGFDDFPRSSDPTPPAGAWHKALNRYHWFVLVACSLGWLFDTMDQQLFNLARRPAMLELLHVTPGDTVAAARVLSEFAPVLHDPEGPLYPPLERVREVSFRVALEVAREAQRAGLAEMDPDSLEQIISGKMWKPDYVPLRRVAS